MYMIYGLDPGASAMARIASVFPFCWVTSLHAARLGPGHR
jgi:hypothetical protein